MSLPLPNADRTSLLAVVGRQMGASIQLWDDASIAVRFDCGCWECGKKYKRAVWLVRHVRAKHG